MVPPVASMTMFGFFCATAYWNDASVNTKTNAKANLCRWTIANLQSVCFQACRPKLLAHTPDQNSGRGLRVFERVIDTELLPFVTTHLMKRQYVYPLNVAEFGGERCDVIDVRFVVSQIRHQHVTQPDRPFQFRETTRKVQCWANIFPREVFVPFRVPGLHIQQHEIGVLELFV